MKPTGHVKYVVLTAAAQGHFSRARAMSAEHASVTPGSMKPARRRVSSVIAPGAGLIYPTPHFWVL
jgi:hypothetical protein